MENCDPARAHKMHRRLDSGLALMGGHYCENPVPTKVVTITDDPVASTHGESRTRRSGSPEKRKRCFTRAPRLAAEYK